MRIYSGAMIAPGKIINPKTGKDVETRFMVDTGSDFTAICLTLAQKVDLRPKEWVLVQGVDRDPFTAPVFTADLLLQNCPISQVRVVGLDFHGLGYGGLIGNDVLDKGLLVRDGETGHWYFALGSGSCASTCATKPQWGYYALAGAAGLLVGAGIVLLTKK